MTKVFVHGNPECDAIWGPLTDALASRGVDDVVLLSPPGFGAPTPEGWDPTIRSYLDWLAAELERIGGEIDLVGHDWGAGFTFGVMAERGDLVRSWAADCGGLLHPDYQWHDMAQTWQTPEAGEAAIEFMTSLSPAERAEIYVGLGLSDGIAASMADAFDDEMGRCILALYRDAAQPAMTELGDRLAAAPRRPSAIIDALDDPYVPTAMSKAVADRIGARHLPLEYQSHWWMVEAPDPAADALVAFWAGL